MLKLKKNAALRSDKDKQQMKRRTIFVLATLLLNLFISISIAQTYKIKRVIDGDTLLLLTIGEYVRLIGVDTPETKHPKKESSILGKPVSSLRRWLKERKLGLNMTGHL